ncbi:MAG: hypothetical protein IVW56_09515 [Candidatus Binataceae bacterium]|nr:hypothetical protein [Candidatus Binataceae bacterium]
MSARIQAACRRCGGGDLGAEVTVWGVFEVGALVNVDLSQSIEVKRRGWAICLDCGEAQPIQAEESTT